MANLTTAQSPGRDGEPAQPRPVVVPETLDLLLREQETREELTYEQKLALDHASTFARIPVEKARELREKLKEVSARVTDFHAAKIVDLAPTHPDDVRAIFARDRSPLEKEDIDKIIETVRGYL